MKRSYTGKGDFGETSLWGGTRVLKNNPYIIAVGEIDEANAVLGLAASFIKDRKIKDIIFYLQNTFFIVGAEISAASAGKRPLYKISDSHIKKIEGFIENIDSQLPELNAFILPTGSSGVTTLHLARSTVRRAERSVIQANIKQITLLIKFLNRSSSLLFSMARWQNIKEDGTEKNPTYT